MKTPAERYMGFQDLANVQAEGSDYRVLVRGIHGSSIAVIAPHGGCIEQGTSDVARAIAGEDINLYLFEGIRRSGNYAALHLTSHKFDEPRCLEMLSHCNYVIAVHGCRGNEPQILIGGLDASLKARVAKALAELGIETRVQGHQFPATEPNNICNRGQRGAGVQIEMTMALRRQGPCQEISAAIRAVLLELPR